LRIISLQILIQIDEIEFDAFATQFQTIVNAIIDSEVVTVIVLSDDDA
jgi:hypothetical protein